MLSEERQEYENYLDTRDGERLHDAIAYSERENLNLLKEVDRLEKLIAALLEALKAALEFVHSVSSFVGKESVTEKKIKAAIAKVEGE